MAAISTKNQSQVKIKFDHGTDLNGDRIIKTRTYSAIKATATDQTILDVVNKIAELQQHTLSGINRIDNISISE